MKYAKAYEIFASQMLRGEFYFTFCVSKIFHNPKDYFISHSDISFNLVSPPLLWYNIQKAVIDIKTFCFTVDDNIRFLKEITASNYQSIFEHPYLAMFKRLHKKFDLKVQLNLFYRMESFDLSKMSSAYYSEWRDNADWLKLSFHSDFENEKPYEFSKYKEVYQDCKKTNEQIIRFSSPFALAQTTTVHYCLTTEEGLNALMDNNVLGLLGLFGDEQNPQISYGLTETMAKRIRGGETVKSGAISFASIDIVLNCFSKQEILNRLENLIERNNIRLMIHEQYFYSDYKWYQPDFEEKLNAAFSFLKLRGYKSSFFEDLI